jgi:multiple sugar transport system substrate-binding protein
MKRFKPILRCFAVVVSLSMILSLAACGKGKPTQAEESKEIKITMLQPGLEQPDMKQATQKQIDAFQKDNPNIKVELMTVGWDQAYDKLVNMFQSDSAPDVIYTGSRWIVPFANMKGIIPLDKYFNESKKSMYPESLIEGQTFNGNIYGVPRAFSSKVLFYRSDWIKEPPKTWEELIKVAQQVQNEHPGVFGYAIAGAKHVSTTDHFFDVLYSYGGKVFDDSGNVALDSPESIKALQLYSDLYNKYKIVPNPIEYNREQLPALFKQGKIAMFECGPWAKNTIGNISDATIPYKIALIPSGTEQHCILNSDALVISAKSKNPDAAWKLIDYLTSEKMQTEYDKDHGLTPIQIKEAQSSEFKNDPYFSVFVKAIDNGISQPMPKLWEPFQDIVTNTVQKALQGNDVKSALNDACKQIKEKELEPTK